MTVRARGNGLFPDDEELGKKNDDFHANKMSKWSVRARPGGWRKRRILGVVLGCIALYFFIVNIPRDLGPVNARLRPNRPVYGNARGGRAVPKSEYNFDRQDVYPPELADNAAAGAAARAAKEDLEDPTLRKDLSYDGPVRFYNLATTLRPIAAMGAGNKHVLFAASDLKTAGSLIPMACEMAGWKRNIVHFAIMGRDKIPISEIIEMNGASTPQCAVHWHDGRPDHAEDSTGPRMQLSVTGAMGHIQNYMHPRAVITADAEDENVFFTAGLGRSVRQFALTHIEIPKAKPETLAWLARLDAGSLNAWHSAGIDVMVQAPLESAGSLIRLLRSLASADYTGFTPPRLTIELPHKVDEATRNFLTNFRWPPYQYLKNPTAPDELITRRRISEQHITSDEASLRFVESFYPSSEKGPHVLLLSPQAELSPAFFHYLKLHLLEYRYSPERVDDHRKLFGISLENPSLYLNGTTRFVPPPAYQVKEDDGVYSPFRWQAPTSNAALYFSDKWIEFHSFLTKRRTATLHPRTQEHHAKRVKLVSEHQPSWVEYALDVMRTRGYSLHYPGMLSPSKGQDQSLVIVHNELYQQPEEFAHAPANNLVKRDTTDEPEQSEDSVLTVTADPVDYLLAHHPAQDESQEINDERPLLRNLLPLLPELELASSRSATGQPDVIPKTLPLPDLARLPLLLYSGELISSRELQVVARTTRIGFRHIAGGCSDKAANVDNIQPLSAEDLFCLGDVRTITMSQPLSQNDPAQPISGAVTSHGEDIGPSGGKLVNAAKNVAAAAAGAIAGKSNTDNDKPSRAENPVLDGNVAPNRDAPVPAANQPNNHPGARNFEDEMAARDAARADALTDRARNQDTKPKPAAGVFKLRTLTEDDDEDAAMPQSNHNAANAPAPPPSKPQPGVFKLRTANEDDDEEAIARKGLVRANNAAAPPPDSPIPPPPPTKTETGTKAHSYPGDPNAPIPEFRGQGAAEHVAAVDNPAKYAETARAAFLANLGSSDQNPPAQPQPQAQAKPVNNAAADTDKQEPANLPGAPEQEQEQKQDTPTPTKSYPGDPNAPIPKLRGQGAAEHVAAVEDTVKYAETARAAFLEGVRKAEEEGGKAPGW